MGYKIIVTFDLENAETSDYEKAKKILSEYGLFPTSPKKDLQLPSTTLMGNFDSNISADDIKIFIWNLFKENGLKPKRLLGGILQDWSIKSKN